MNQYHQPLLPNHTYHLFSRTVGSEKLFLGPENYLFFLQKLKQHTSPVCNLYCYTLIPNHFHLLTKMKKQEAIIQHFEKVKKVTFQPPKHDLSDFMMVKVQQFFKQLHQSLQ